MSTVKGQRSRILPPYTQWADDYQHRLIKTLAVSGMVLMAMFLGYLLAVFGSFGWFIPAVPVVIMTGLALWLAPDVGTDLLRPISFLTMVYWVITLVWPDYMAFNFPGLPWISLSRLASFPLALAVLYALATSSHARAEVGARFQSHKLLTWLVVAWIGWQAIMLFVGGLTAPGRWVNDMINYYLMLLIMAWIFTDMSNVRRIYHILLVTTVITSIITLWEYYLKAVPWAGHIPAFLNVSDTYLQKVNSFNIRSGQYRASSIFLTAPTYGEYIGMMLPFVMLFILQAVKPWRFVVGMLMLVLLFVAALESNARTSMVAFASVPAGMIAIWILKRFRRPEGRQDLLASSLAYGLPAAGLVLVAAVLSIGRIRHRVLGGGEHAASNEGREAQWDMALPVIMKNPFGYGAGTIQQHVPYTNRAGVFTIDSYPINILVEYGVPGFLLFFGIFICAVVIGVKVYLRAERPEEELAGAAALALVSFMTTRLVISLSSGMKYAFPLVGLILALWYVQKIRSGWVPRGKYRVTDEGDSGPKLVHAAPGKAGRR